MSVMQAILLASATDVNLYWVFLYVNTTVIHVFTFLLSIQSPLEVLHLKAANRAHLCYCYTPILRVIQGCQSVWSASAITWPPEYMLSNMGELRRVATCWHVMSLGLGLWDSGGIFHCELLAPCILFVNSKSWQGRIGWLSGYSKKLMSQTSPKHYTQTRLRSIGAWHLPSIPSFLKSFHIIIRHFGQGCICKSLRRLESHQSSFSLHQLQGFKG